MLLSIGDHVRPGTYRFHSRFERVVNFEHEGRLIAVVDAAIGPGPLNIVLRDLRFIRAQGHAEPAPSILKGLNPSAQGWIAPPFPGDPTLGKGPRKAPNPEGVESRHPFGSLLQVSPSTVLFGGRRYHYTARHRYDSALDLAVMMQSPSALLSRGDAMDAKRQGRSRTARSVWSASSLLALSSKVRRFESGSKLHALQTLRAAAHPQIASRLVHNLSVLGDSLKEAAPAKSLAFLLDGKRRKSFRAGFERAFARQITRGVREVFHGRLLQGIRQLKGCGLGLTPAGDDFIAGFLIGLHLLQELRGQDMQSTADAVFRTARGKNIFSNTFLDLARRGLLFGRLKDLLLALVSGSEGSVRKAAGKLFGIGETSGADLATGLFITLQSGVS